MWAQTIVGIDFGAKLFASCWIKQDVEDIVQWSMYGNSMRGVRISLPDDPFEWQLLNAYHQVPGTDAKWQFDNAEAPFSLDEVFRSEEHTSELQSLMRISYAVFCLTKKKITHQK